MFKREILTSNEKVRKIRKALKVKQDALVLGSSISREMVSRIENNKNNLTPQTAEIFSYNINRIIKEHKLNWGPITPEFLLEDQDSAADRIIWLNIKKLKELPMHKDSDEQITIVKDEIEGLIEDFEIKELTIYSYYDALNDFYYQKHEYNKCSSYLFKCFEIATKNQSNEHILNVYMKNIRVYNNQKKYKESVDTGNYAIEFAKMHNINDAKYLKPIYFNVAKAYRNLNQNEECLRWIKYIEDSYVLGEIESMDVMTLKANCLHSINDNEQSLKINYSILDIAIIYSDANRIALAYKNITDNYIKLKMLDKADESLYQVLSIDTKLEDEYMFDIYKCAHELSIKIGRALMVIENYYKKATIFGKKLHDEKGIFDLTMDMIEYCYNSKNYELMKEIILDIHNDIKNGNYLECNISMFYYFTSFYMKLVDLEISEQLQIQGIELLRKKD